MKLIFSTLGALLVMSACSSKPENGFVVNGTVDGAANGEEIFLSYQVNDSTINDTTVIADGKFRFEGEVPRYGAKAYLKYGEESQPYQGDNFLVVYLEPGPTEVEVKKGDMDNSVITGSRQNDIEKEYMDYIKGLHERRSSLDRESDDYKEQMAAIDDDFQNYQIESIMKNADTYWAFNLFSMVGDRIPLEMCDSITSIMPEELLALQPKIRKSIETRRKIQPGMPAPVLKGNDPLRDSMVSLDQLKGKYVLIDFWATWCHGCVLALPHIREVYDRYHDKGLEVMCVTSDDVKDDWVDYMREHDMGVYYNIPGRIKEDGELGGRDDEDQTDLYNINYIPQTYLVDPEGKIVAHLSGEEEIDEMMEKIFGK